MNKAPAFQFYPSDFLSDENVMLMSNQEVGCYIKLICFNWKQGSIPDDINKIARLCGEDTSVMAELWHSLKRCFISNGTNGRLINPRVEKERLKQKKYRKERSESGKKGAVKRWKSHKKRNNNSSAIAKPMAKPMANDSSSSSSSTSVKKKVNKEKFSEFVSMTKDQYKTLCDKHTKSNTDTMIQILDNYKGSKGKTYKCDYRAILSWVVDKVMQNNPTPNVSRTNKKPPCVKCGLESIGDHDGVDYCPDCWPRARTNKGSRH